MTDLSDNQAGVLRFVSGLMALSGIVFIEPAPFDLAAIILAFILWAQGNLASVKNISTPCFYLWVYIIGTVGSFYFIVDSAISFKFFSITVFLILIWFLFISIATKFGLEGVSSVFAGWAISALVTTIIGILAFFNLFPFQDIILRFGRVMGLFKDPNVYGAFVVPAALFSLMKIESASKAGKFGWILTFGIITLGVLLSFSRAAWLNYLVSMFVFMILWGINLSRGSIYIKKYAIIAIFLISLLAVFAVYNATIGDMFIQRLGFQSYDQVRFSTQIKAINSVAQKPFGVGPGQTEVFLQCATHNLYLRVLNESGIIGFVGFLFLMSASLFRAAGQACKRISGGNAYFALITACLIGLMLNSFFIDSLHWRHLWILLALAWSVEKTE